MHIDNCSLPLIGHQKILVGAKKVRVLPGSTLFIKYFYPSQSIILQLALSVSILEHHHYKIGFFPSFYHGIIVFPSFYHGIIVFSSYLETISEYHCCLQVSIFWELNSLR